MNGTEKIKLVECPRDAMQGLTYFVPTEIKVRYLNLLLKAGFDTLDFGSFVSPKAIPQMADTEEVLCQLDLSNTGTALLAIVANQRGAEKAASFGQIRYIGFPLSVSETFQQRNTNSGIAQGLELVNIMLDICAASEKELVVYLSMAFGNPYGDYYSPSLVTDFAGKLAASGCKIISLADTVGLATSDQIINLGQSVTTQFPGLETGMHLHAKPAEAAAKAEAALASGCNRIDTALGGLGGCPFAQDELTGNMPSGVVLELLQRKNIPSGIDEKVLREAEQLLRSHILL